MSQEKGLVIYNNPSDLKKYLDTAKGVIGAALPKHLNADRMLRLALTAFSTTPKLRECTAESILASIVIASQVGLEPGVRGQGYLIPYFDNRKRVSICTFVPGWQGLVGLLNNSGRATAWTGAVFQGDEFDFQLGSHPRCIHTPGDQAGDPSKLTHVYACGQVNGSQLPVIECWTMPRVWAHRDKFNKVGEQHYSYRHPEMYARKVVLLQVLKYMPASVELSNAMTAADASEMNRTARVEQGIVIDVDDSQGLGEGNVGGGASITETAGSEQKAADQKTTPQGEPTGDELYKSILSKGAAVNAGKGKIQKTLIAMKWIEPADVLEKLPVEKLATIIDGWDEVADQIKNPGAAS